MNNNSLKKIIALLTSTLLLNATAPLMSSANNKYDPEQEYIEMAMDKYLTSYNVNRDAVYISDSYHVYNMDRDDSSNVRYNPTDVYIVFEDNSIIGMLSVNKISGNYYSSFEYNTYDILQDIYDDEGFFSFVSQNEKLFVETNSNVYPIYGANDQIQYDFSKTQEKKLDKSRKLSLSESTRELQSQLYQKNLLVPIVPNESINGGLCWAAAIASKIDFLNNDTLLAHDVFYDLEDEYSTTPEGYPLWIIRGYDYYNAPCTYLDRMLNCVEVYNNIQNDNPIHISLTGSGVGHSVLLSGITINTDATGIYRLVDSNRNVYVDVIVSEDTMVADDDFVYVTNYGYTFTHWRWSFY